MALRGKQTLLPIAENAPNSQIRPHISTYNGMSLISISEINQRKDTWTGNVSVKE